jgi:hypothetical protein
MTNRLARLIAVPVFGLLVSTPAYLQAQQPGQGQQHDEHHQATPDRAEAAQPPGTRPQANAAASRNDTDQQVEELVRKMNSAAGPAKVDAIAELLTLLVQRQHAMHAMHESMMAHMSMMMNKMHNGAGAETRKEPSQR